MKDSLQHAYGRKRIYKVVRNCWENKWDREEGETESERKEENGIEE